MQLPEPNLVLAKQSQRLLDFILNEIKEKGPITFSDYMRKALYEPGLGYYSSGTVKFGKAGDFVTAPEISPLFSRCLARQCQQVLSELEDGCILELEAGSGVMAADILLELEALNALPKAYYILEVSADLRSRQQVCLKEQVPYLFDRVEWLDTLPKEDWQGIVIANEVLDAMPVHRFKQEEGVKEYYVGSKNDKLVWELRLPSTPMLEAQIKALNIEFDEGYTSEINVWVEPWLAGLSAALQKGIILIIDYGFLREEYYHPHRSMGTLMCHYQHRAHDNPLVFPGIQDITAHVDFTAVSEAAEKIGLSVLEYTNQANFLIHCGITEMAVCENDAEQQYVLAQQVKQLMLPSEMGELFKVMVLGRNFGSSLTRILHQLS